MSDEYVIQGAMTNDKPFTVSTNDPVEKIVLYKGSQIFSATNLDEATTKTIVECLNEAYQRGYHDASIQLMNK